MAQSLNTAGSFLGNASKSTDHHHSCSFVLFHFLTVKSKFIHARTPGPPFIHFRSLKRSRSLHLYGHSNHSNPLISSHVHFKTVRTTSSHIFLTILFFAFIPILDYSKLISYSATLSFSPVESATVLQYVFRKSFASKCLEGDILTKTRIINEKS